MWPDHRLLDLFAIELPIIQAPMAVANAASNAGTLDRKLDARSLTREAATEARRRIAQFADRRQS